jgi:hypothetical protein
LDEYLEWKSQFTEKLLTIQMKWTKNNNLPSSQIGLEAQIKFWHDIGRVFSLLEEVGLALACHHKVITLQENLSHFSYKQWINFGDRCAALVWRNTMEYLGILLI